MKLKTVGIVGGIAPESTIDYYRQIVDGYRKHSPAGNYPSIIINSINLRLMIDLITNNELSAVANYLVEALERLNGAGADFAVLASNTPHIVFDDVSARSPLPLISIVESACAYAEARQMKTVALFGTRFTMNAAFYPDVFARAGIKLVRPDEQEREYIHSHYMDELINGIFLPETRQALLQIVDRVNERERLDGVILGGTELPLVIQAESHNGIPFLDTTRIHVGRIVEELLAI